MVGALGRDGTQTPTDRQRLVTERERSATATGGDR